MKNEKYPAETMKFAAADAPDLLHSYRELLTKVDLLCGKIEEEFAGHLACRAGCDGCCRHITLFRVEAAALAAALTDLPAEAVEHIRARAGRSSSGDPCPLLENGRCLLYEARPIICRTHGLPILAVREGKRTVDFCPLNFQGLDSLPGSAVIDLDRLNTLLATVNALFVTQFSQGVPPEKDRLSIAETLTIEL